MRKLIIIIFTLFLTLNIFSNRFWNNEKNYKQFLTVESIVSYSPSIVNYIYIDDNSYGYYFSDSVQWTHMFNLYPFCQIGYTINYRWLWGLRTFVLSNTYRWFGLNIDIYNLTLQVAILDTGFSWFKYEWNRQITGRNNQFCLLISPITINLNYRIMLNNSIDIMINAGYSLQVIVNNKIYFPNSNVNAKMFMEHSFNSGIGFRFYTKKRFRGT